MCNISLISLCFSLLLSSPDARADRKVHCKLLKVCHHLSLSPPLMWASQGMTWSSLNCLTFRKKGLSSHRLQPEIVSSPGLKPKRSMRRYWKAALFLPLFLCLMSSKEQQRNFRDLTLLMSFWIKRTSHMFSFGHIHLGNKSQRCDSSITRLWVIIYSNCLIQAFKWGLHKQPD